jgi:hypothetical protein
LDTELQVVHAVDEDPGRFEEAVAALAEWRDIKDTYVPKTVAVWHDPKPLEYVLKWMEHPGIVWTSHTLFAEALAKASGRPYYGQNGLDAEGNKIPEKGHPACGKGAIIASTDANCTGRNLQMWHRNLITSVPSNAPIWEQLLGRTHRDGQPADTVTVDLMMGCAEHRNSLEKSRELARSQLDMLGHTQKLLLADIILPHLGMGPRWTAPSD